MLALFSLALLLLPVVASAQEDVLRPRIPSGLFTPVTIGIEGGLNYNFFGQDLVFSPTASPESPLNVFESGTGISPYAALVIDLPLNSWLALQVKGTFDAKRFGNKESGKADCPGPVISTIVDVETDYEVTANYAGVGLGLRIDASPDVFVTVGPIVHFRVGDAIHDRTETISRLLATASGSTSLGI
jgi:hypothetical protein